MLSETFGVAFMGHFQCVTTKYVTEKKKENCFEVYTYQLSFPLSLSLQYVKLPIIIEILSL